jgi:hypothetical protein
MNDTPSKPVTESAAASLARSEAKIAAGQTVPLEPMLKDTRSIDVIKDLGSGRPAPETVEQLYRLAFQEFGAQLLWSRKPSEHPTIAQALVIAEALRREGNMKSRPLAAKIEEACRAAL